MRLVTETKPQSQVWLIYSTRVHPMALAPLLLLTRLLTIMRRIVMNLGMLYVMISECYLIDDGYRET
jgi:hypothetical protein